MRFPRSRENAPTFAEKRGQARRCITRGTETGWSSPMTRVWSCLLSGVRPECIPQGTPGCRRQNSQRIEKTAGRDARQRGASERAAYFRFARLHWRNADEPWPIVTDRVDGEILEAPRGSGGLLAMIRCSTSQPSRKTFAELPAEEKNQRSHRGKAVRKLLAGSFLHAIVFRSYGDQVEEKRHRRKKENLLRTDRKTAKTTRSAKTGACGGNRS